MVPWLNSVSEYGVKFLCQFVILNCFVLTSQLIGNYHLAWAESSLDEILPSPPVDPDDTEIVINGNYDIVDECMNRVNRRIRHSEKSKYGKLTISGHPLVTRSRKFGIVFRLDFDHPLRKESGDPYRFICWSAPPHTPPYEIRISVGISPGKPLRQFR